MDRKKRNGILFTLTLLVSGVIAGLILIHASGPGSRVRVIVNGEVRGDYSLETEARVEIAGWDGGKNVLRVKGGEAWMEEADCPDGLCIRTGRIGRTGQTIVCLPHRVVIRITPEPGREAEADTVTGR